MSKNKYSASYAISQIAQGPHPSRTHCYGPDKDGRHWRDDYGEVEFLACTMECGGYMGTLSDQYWDAVDVWFNRHYPERWTKADDNGHMSTVGYVFHGQMGFKVALWKWLGDTYAKKIKAGSSLQVHSG